MAATLKRQRKLPHYQRQQLGKRHDSSGRKRCQKQFFFSFPHKGRTQFLFPSCGLLSYESWAWHAFHADCLIVEIKRTMSKILIRTTTGAKTLTIYPDRTCSVSKTLWFHYREINAIISTSNKVDFKPSSDEECTQTDIAFSFNSARQVENGFQQYYSTSLH